MRKILSVIFMIAAVAMFGLTGCNSDEKLAQEKQITRIKTIHANVYNAYFSQSEAGMETFTLSSAVGLDDYLEENGEDCNSLATKGVYDKVYAWYTVIVQTVIELKGVDVISEKYIITEDTNLVSKVSEKFVDIEANDYFDPIKYTEAVSSLEICGLKDNTVFSRVVINEMSCDFLVYYNNASDYGFAISLTGTYENMVQYNKAAGGYLYIEETEAGYYYSNSVKDITLRQNNPDESGLIDEVEDRLNTFATDFDNNVKLFPEKQEVTLIFD